MSTNRSNDRSSLCSFTFVDGRHRPVSSRAQRRIRFRRRSGGLQTGQRDGRERPWCPVAPPSEAGCFSRIPSVACLPQAGEGPAFRRRSGGLQTGSTMAASALVSSRAQPRDPLFAGCVQILPLAQDEYINAYGTDTWRETIRTSHEQSADHMSPDRESPSPDSAPAPFPAAPSDASPT